MADAQQYLDPTILARLRGLEVQARSIVEGYLSGRHKSPYHGFSVEFAQHREYVPGDDVKHVDWKVWARTEKYYLKQYEEETNLVCWLLVDVSESMHYRSNELSKYDYACLTAASLAYLIVHQQDSVGLVTFDDQIRSLLRPLSQPSHLKEVIGVLGRGPGPARTKLAPVFHDLAERIPRRALVVILSDLFDDPADILAGLKHLRFKRHEVVVFHVLDAAEADFPFQEATLFRGLEQMPELLTDPRALRRSYLEQLRAFIEEVRRGCGSQDIDFVPLRTDTPVETALTSYLAHRLALKGF